MKPIYLAIITLLCAVLAVVGPASAAPADIAVVSSSLDPPVLMKGDTGTLTIVIQNTGAEAVAIRSARLYGSGVVPLSEPYPDGRGAWRREQQDVHLHRPGGRGRGDVLPAVRA